MTKPLELVTGERFGRLSVIERTVAIGKSLNSYWLCLCDCGKKRTVRGAHLKAGATTSCGCYVRERLNVIRKAKRTYKNIAHLDINGYRKACKKESARTLSDSYIIDQITKRSVLATPDIPRVLVSAKRAQLKLSRLVKERQENEQRERI